MIDDQKTVSLEEYEALKNEFEEFIYIVSHDFNGPMRHIREFSRLLLKSLDDKISTEERKYASFIEKSVMHNEAMLEALLKLSRLNTEAHEFVKIDCNEIIKNILEHKAEDITKYNIVINCSTLPIITGDQEQIRTLFFNLIDNAIKFRRKDVKPIINISCDKQDEKWLFCIEDNGIGIEKGLEDKIFKLFRKLNSDIDYPGTGAGLTLSKKIIERHGNKLWVESEQEVGSKFFFTLSIA